MKRKRYELDCREGDFILVASLETIRETLEQVFFDITNVFVLLEISDEDGEIDVHFHSENYENLSQEVLDEFDKKGWLKDDWKDVLFSITKSTIVEYPRVFNDS